MSKQRALKTPEHPSISALTRIKPGEVVIYYRGGLIEKDIEIARKENALTYAQVLQDIVSCAETLESEGRVRLTRIEVLVGRVRIVEHRAQGTFGTTLI